MAVYFPETDDIYFKKTKIYFQEVVSSYSNGNYRSAIVMLYSVAVCDILFKLQELKDMYNDTVAEQILQEVDKSRNEHDSKSKSKWEKELIDNVYEKTQLLDLEAYTNLNHLYDHRNFSAHPALNENYELIAPPKETTVASIKNILKDILIKPPIFIKNITETLTEDLKGKSELYENEHDKLTTYLNNKYFSKMTINMKLAVFKAFWKFCFCLPDDENCMNNLIINRQALEILVSGIERDVLEEIKENPNYYGVAQNNECIINLIMFVTQFIAFYNELNEEIKLQVDNVIDKYDNAKGLAWFKYTTPRAHFDFLKKINCLSLSDNIIQRMYSHYSTIGETEKLLSFFVWYYGKSYSYDTANERFEQVIEPFLDKMNAEHFEAIIIFTDNNSQIYNRNQAYNANNQIMRYAYKKLDKEFDYSNYPNFRFDSAILNEKSGDNEQNEEFLF